MAIGAPSACSALARQATSIRWIEPERVDTASKAALRRIGQAGGTGAADVERAGERQTAEWVERRVLHQLDHGIAVAGANDVIRAGDQAELPLVRASDFPRRFDGDRFGR